MPDLTNAILAPLTLQAIVSSAVGGVIGNAANVFVRHAVTGAWRAIRADTTEPVRHDIAQTIRLAHLTALEHVLDSYERYNAHTWEESCTVPTAFLQGAATFCRAQRYAAIENPSSLAIPLIDPLALTFDGLLAPQPAKTLAADYHAIYAEAAESAVLQELQTGLSVPTPDSFSLFLNTGAPPGYQNFLAEFAIEIREAVKTNDRFRNIMIVSSIAELKSQGFEVGEILRRVESGTGVSASRIQSAINGLEGTIGHLDTKMDAILARLSGNAEFTIPLPTLRTILAGFGELSDEFDLTAIEQTLRGKAVEYVELQSRLRRLSNDDPVVAKLHTEAADHLAAARFSEVDVALARAERIDLDSVGELEAIATQRRRSAATSRAERAAAASLRLAYREAAAHYEAAASMISESDIPARVAYLSRQIDSLIQQGNEFGDELAFTEAVTAARFALGLTPRASEPLKWANAQSKLGIVLTNLGEHKGRKAHLEEAVIIFRKALAECTRDRAPLDWARIQGNLGNALETLGTWDDGTGRLEEAVIAHRAALEEVSRDLEPQSWGIAQNNLGIALSKLGYRENSGARMEEALVAYHEALLVRTRDITPIFFAITQLNLAAALGRLHEQANGTTRAEEAVAACRAALLVWTRDNAPLKWAFAQLNLGNSLLILNPKEIGFPNLARAATAYRAALEVLTRGRAPLHWASALDNLGSILVLLGARASDLLTLNEAVAAHRAALEVRARDLSPHEWASAQCRLGHALVVLGIVSGESAPLVESIELIRTALDELKRDKLPRIWARAQFQLGQAYETLGNHETDTASLQHAMTHYDAALSIEPAECTATEMETFREKRDFVAALIAQRRA